MFVHDFGLDLVFICRLAGILGFLCYIGGFAALQFRWIDGEGIWYSSSKIFGAALVLISLTVDFNLSAALIQVSFLGIGLTGLSLRLRQRRQGKGQESGVIDTVFQPQGTELEQHRYRLHHRSEETGPARVPDQDSLIQFPQRQA